ncbi:MarR family winged helix-turn-helix transcriptional regulator [Planctomicrobium sp. SH664]|uniref:MarR family winged helix-turn-helix transcriptional regulator n=1 Tax=Planctomicrobium sp. SH664 TaxID=3448125 RepID=UPI003F5C1D9E
MTTSLREDLKKRGPFASREQELMISLARTTDRLGFQLEKLLADYGLTGSQFNVLRILNGEGRPLPVQEIASRTIQVVPGITGLIDRLEKAELVQRSRSTEDRRVIFVSITPKAKSLLKKIERPLLEREKQLLGSLSAAEQQQMILLLEKIRQGSLQELSPKSVR